MPPSLYKMDKHATSGGAIAPPLVAAIRMEKASYVGKATDRKSEAALAPIAPETAFWFP